MTRVQWLVCIVASVGFAFDIYEILMLPLIVRPALIELGGLSQGTPEYAAWAGRLFWVPAIAGGIFGLLGGYLTDRLGRRFVLTWSILIYAFSASAAAFATSLPLLLLLRCTTFIGVCVEFVAATAWLAELFPEPRQREKVLGYTQAFSSFGGLMVSSVYTWCATYGKDLPAIGGGHDAWRYTLISGLIPAVPLIVIRPFLPESPTWARKKAEGTLKRPSLAEIFRPQYRRATIVATLMFAFSYGAAFGAIQQMPQIVPGLAEVKPLQRPQQQQIAGAVQMVQEAGGLAGRFALAALAAVIVSRRGLLRLFQVPGLFVLPLVFLYAPTLDVAMVKWGMFFAGFFTVAQFSFWGNYLPRVYPTHLRGTGESFAANIGGRLLGTSFAWITSMIAVQPFVPGATPPTKLAYAAAGVALFVYAGGLALSFLLPEPPRDLPE